jgi:hypothetical protein
LLPPSLLLLATLSQTPENGEALIREMHGRYDGKWYQTLTFVQKTTAEGKVETWYEAARIPGFLRIDIAPIDSANAMIFRSDSIYVFRGGQPRAARPLVHPLMVLGFDVYADSPDKTIEKLRGLGFDLAKLREDTWQGRPAYVVGAQPGDSTSGQFWIDKENLLFVRMIQQGQNNSTVETQFNKYQRLGQGWIAPEVLFLRNGQVVTTEEYGDIRADVTLPSDLFEPRYAPPAWVPARP